MADDFSRALAKVAVAQIAEVAGAEACQESGVDILTDLLVRYITQLCSGAHDYAEVAGRTEFNVVDVLQSLEDLGTTADELRQYVELQVVVVPCMGIDAWWVSELRAATGVAFWCASPAG